MKRETYVRRTTAVIFLLLLVPLMIIARVAELGLGVSGYVTCSIAGVVGTTVAVLVAEKKANRKYGGK